jgi:putative aldouronate transport system substrate-binding protein
VDNQMSKITKKLSLLIAMIMCFVLLGSCSPASSGPSNPDTSKETPTQKPSSNEAESEEDLNPLGEHFSGYPIESEDAKLSLWTYNLRYHNDYTSEDESPYHNYLSEFTGVDIEWHRPAAGENGSQAFNLLLASGELPDIIFIGGLPDIAETLLGEGYIIPLDDYMPNYAPALYAYLMENTETMKAIKSDSGKLYNFPFLREDVLWQGSYIGNVVNTEYLNQVGLDIPETFDEWENAFYALKDVCDIVFATNSAIRLQYFFANPFEVATDNYYLDNGQVKASFVGDNYYEFLKKMNQFYKDGLIDPDFVTADTNGFSATFVASKVGVATTGQVTFGYVYDQVVDRDGEWNYVPVPYPVSKKGDPVKFVKGESLWTGTGAMITTACENVELACRFLDYGYTEEGIITWNFGKEGESFEYVDGVPTLVPAITEAEEGISNAVSRYTSMTANGISFMSLEFTKQRNLDFANWVTDVCTSNAEQALEYKLPPISSTEEESRIISDIQTTINTYVNEMYVGFIIGSESLDNYDTYIKNLESMGLQRLLDIKQEQLDRYNAR